MLNLSTVVFANLLAFEEFNFHKQRLNEFLQQSGSFRRLWDVMRMLLILSHGQASVGKGFSINRQVMFDVGYLAALNISTGPLALRTFQTAGPVRASTLYLSLALQDHQVKCRASRLKITVARSMTNFATFSCILCLKFRYVCIA